MRRTVASQSAQEETKPTQYSLKAPTTAKPKEKVVAEEERPMVREKHRSTGLPILVRLSILLFATVAGLALVGMLAAQQTGVALGSLPGQIDFKAAYSPNNLTQTKAFAFLKLGNRKGAMALVKTLPAGFNSDEASEPEFSQVRIDLITAQLQAGEFADALQVATQLPTQLETVLQTQTEREGLDAAIANAKTLPPSLKAQRDNALSLVGGRLLEKNWADSRRLLDLLETPIARDTLLGELLRTYPAEKSLEEGFALASQHSNPTLQVQSLSSLGHRYIKVELRPNGNSDQIITDEAKVFQVLDRIKSLNTTDTSFFTGTVVGILAKETPQKAFEVLQRYGIRSNDTGTLQQIAASAIAHSDFALAEKVADQILKTPPQKTTNAGTNTVTEFKIGTLYARSVFSDMFQKLKDSNPDEAIRIAKRMETDSQQLSLLELLARESLTKNNRAVFQKTLTALKSLPGPAAAQTGARLVQQAALERQWQP